MRKFAHRLARFLIRISSFISKEFFSVISQPRLLGVLVLGPFLILLLFGISYRNIYRTLQMVVVYPPDSPLEETIKGYAQLEVPGLQVMDVTSNAAGALSELQDQQVDLVMVVPEDVMKRLEDNQQAVFTFYHRQIDPVEVAYADIVANRITEEINRQILLATVERSKQTAQDILQQMDQTSPEQLSALLEQGQPTLESAAGLDTFGPAAIAWLLLRAAGGQVDSLPQELQSAGAPTPSNLNQQADELLIRFIETNPDILVRPFRRDTHSMGRSDIQPVDFYVPAVLALLLQHIAMSLGGLSIVRERLSGTMELMRAAPVNAFEVLLGKYLSFTLLIGFVAAALSALVLLIMDVPLAGSLALYTLVIFLVVLASLGFGFLISNFASSSNQAIQLSMVILLSSIFFAGFFIPLYRLWWPAQTVSWALPATYGTLMLQEIMLNGLQPDLWLFAVLAGMAGLLFLVNWLRLRWLMVHA